MGIEVHGPLSHVLPGGRPSAPSFGQCFSGISGERPGTISSARILFARLGPLDEPGTAEALEAVRHRVDAGQVPPDSLDPAVEAMIRNRDAGATPGEEPRDHVLRARNDGFNAFCDAMEDRSPRHPGRETIGG